MCKFIHVLFFVKKETYCCIKSDNRINTQKSRMTSTKNEKKILLMILKNHLPYSRFFLAGHKFGRYEPERYTINFSGHNFGESYFFS